MAQTVRNGDSTSFVIPQAFADLTGNIATGQLPSGTPMQSTYLNLTALAASISATTLYAVASTGLYRLSSIIARTQIATTSSTIPSLTIVWTDGNNSAAGSSTLFATNSTNTLVAVTPVELLVYAKTGTNITYATAGYVSSGATPMQYCCRIKVEAL